MATGTLFWGLTEIWRGIQKRSLENLLSYLYVETICQNKHGGSGLGPFAQGVSQACGANDQYEIPVMEYLNGFTYFPRQGWSNMYKPDPTAGAGFNKQKRNDWRRISRYFRGHDLETTPLNGDIGKAVENLLEPHEVYQTGPVPQLPPTVPAFVPVIDPFSLPLFHPATDAWHVPVRYAGRVEWPNPWRSPTESSSGGYHPPTERPDLDRDKPRLPRPRPRPGPDDDKYPEQDVVIPIDPVPGRPQPYRPVVGGSRRPPRGTKEKKFVLALQGKVQKIVGVVGEMIDIVEAIHDALPKKYQAKAPEGWWRGPTPQDMAWAIYQHADKIDYTEAFNNLVYNHYEDKFYGKIGRINAKASRKFGRPAGFQLGPAM